MSRRTPFLATTVLGLAVGLAGPAVADDRMPATTAVDDPSVKVMQGARQTSAAAPERLSGSNVTGENAPHPLFTRKGDQAELDLPDVEVPLIGSAEAEAVTATPQETVVFFPLDSAELTPQAQAEIAQLAQDVAGEPSTSVLVEGHTDRSASKGYNRALSAERAKRVQQALMDHGVDRDQIVTDWEGETEPLVRTGDGVVLAQNRRVVINVVE